MSDIHLGWVTCSRCNRVLYVEDGPTCPECREIIEAETRSESLRSGGDAEKAEGDSSPQTARNDRSRKKGRLHTYALNEDGTVRECKE